MKILKINNRYEASGEINGRKYISTGKTFYESFENAVSQYIKELFGSTTVTTRGNIPPGYSSDGEYTGQF